MHKRNETSQFDGCGGIPCIVNAVRAGDDRLINMLLRRFTQHAEIETLFQLRSALDSATGLPREPSTAVAPCVIDRQATCSPPKLDDLRTWAACRLGTLPDGRRGHHLPRRSVHAPGSARGRFARGGPSTGGPMSLSVSPELLARAEQGQVSDREFADCVRTSLPYAWDLICALVVRMEAEGTAFADNEVPPPDEQARGQLLRAMASDAIRGALQRHFGVRLAFQNCHRLAVFAPAPGSGERYARFTSVEQQILNQTPEMRDC